MSNLVLRICVAVRTFIQHDEAQDLVEYGMAVALMALGTVAGMQSLASGVDLVFNDVSACIRTYLLK